MARVLTVARDADLRDAIEMALEDGGHDAVCTDSALAALELLGAREFDVVIVESVPPEMMAFRQVREQAAQRGLPWIAIASEVAPPGAASVLKLPFACEELVEALRWALRR